MSERAFLVFDEEVKLRAEERHRQIVERVQAAGEVNVNSLALRFQVTPETIRRDLTALDRAGTVRKIHGGAVRASSLATPETEVANREQLNTEAKYAIARAAVSRLGLVEGATILLDAGTSTGALARLLPEGLQLTVITDSVLIASIWRPETTSMCAFWEGRYAESHRPPSAQKPWKHWQLCEST